MNFAIRILLIDQDPQLTQLVCEHLTATGRYEIHIEADSRIARHTVRNFRPDLILLDLTKAALDRGDVARELHADPHLVQVPIIALSALPSKGEFGSVGFVGDFLFAVTPFHMEDVVRWVGEIFDDDITFFRETA